MRTELLTQSHMDEDNPDGAIAEKVVIKKHNRTRAAGGTTPQKHTQDKVLLEDFGQHNKNLENFGFMESHNGEGNKAVLELQTKVQWLGQRLKAFLGIQTFKDISCLDTSVAALIKQRRIRGTRYSTKKCNGSSGTSAHSCQEGGNQG